MATFESKQFVVRTPSGIQITVPAGEVVNVEVKKNSSSDWVELVTGLTAGVHYFTSYNVLYMRLTADEILTGVGLRIKWYDQTTHQRETAISEFVPATQID